MYGFLMTADGHLTSGGVYSRKRPEIYGDAYSAMSQVYDYAITHQIPTILDGGDLNDFVVADPDQLTFLSSQNEKLRDAGVTVKIIHGNHDKPNNWNSTDTSYFNVLSQFDWVDQQLFELGPLVGYGLDYQSTSELMTEQLAHLDPSVSLLLCHQALDLMAPFNHNMDSAAVPEHVRYVFLGDQHVEYDHTADDTGIRYLYPGSTYLRRFSEPLAKSFIHAKVSDTGEVTIKRVPIESRPFIRRVLKDTDDVSAFLGRLQHDVDYATRRCTVPETTKPFLHVVYHADAADALGAVRRAASQITHLFIQRQTVKQPTRTVDGVTRVVAGANPAELMSQLLVEDTQAYKLALSLVTGEQPERVLAGVKEQLSLQ